MFGPADMMATAAVCGPNQWSVHDGSWMALLQGPCPLCPDMAYKVIKMS